MTQQNSDPALFGYRLTQAEKQIKDMEKEHTEEITRVQDQHKHDIKTLEKEIAKMRDESLKREQKRLIWGIGALGSVIMAMGGVLWSYREVIVRGN